MKCLRCGKEIIGLKCDCGFELDKNSIVLPFRMNGDEENNINLYINNQLEAENDNSKKSMDQTEALIAAIHAQKEKEKAAKAEVAGENAPTGAPKDDNKPKPIFKNISPELIAEIQARRENGVNIDAYEEYRSKALHEIKAYKSNLKYRKTEKAEFEEVKNMYINAVRKAEVGCPLEDDIQRYKKHIDYILTAKESYIEDSSVVYYGIFLGISIISFIINIINKQLFSVYPIKDIATLFKDSFKLSYTDVSEVFIICFIWIGLAASFNFGLGKIKMPVTLKFISCLSFMVMNIIFGLSLNYYVIVIQWFLVMFVCIITFGNVVAANVNNKRKYILFLLSFTISGIIYYITFNGIFSEFENYIREMNY